MAKMSRKAEYQESLKQDILRQTLTLAGEEGWPGVSTRKIADRLQTSTTAIYHYFGGKEAILAELQREGFRQLRDAQLAALAERPDKPKKQLKAVSLAMLRFAKENPERYALMFNLDGAVCHSDAAQEAEEGLQSIRNVLSQLTSDDVESVLMHWFALIQGFVAMAHHDCHPEAIGRFEQLVEDAIGRFIKGL
ncbi:transcriptional regulator, TetR family [Fibrisoma limi BUZ 3]|uniref:Transcriptional regulator, TetR family n=1 Tax=Fibrisoma limi BUZ 3 TaxID=1185876 RepID=I2GMK7_9BACT|nr:TetR/AcrR family transcriptional regulator [Fibrisoma limi]CCH55135.1 transcriptional regulator, TetR family [Fibrisoma limi BUZ 3]